MKILVLADARSVHTSRYVKELERQDCEVRLSSMEKGDIPANPYKHRTGINGLDYTLACRDLNQDIISFKPDIINPHYASGYGYIASLSKTRNIPVVMHCLGSDILVDPHKSFLQKKRIEYILSKCPRILVDSEFLGKAAAIFSSKVKYKVIYWGADEEAFEVFSQRDLKNIYSKRPLRVLVPRPHRGVYNNPYIINALGEKINSGEFEIYFPSWGEQLEKFKNLVRDKCPDGNVSYYDYLTREEFNRMLGDFDIYLSASRSDSSPASLIEAMASGLYPMSGDIPGVREWIDCTNGSLFVLDNPLSLGNEMEKILRCDIKFKSILKANHNWARAEGRFRNNIAETKKIFTEVIEHDRW